MPRPFEKGPRKLYFRLRLFAARGARSTMPRPFEKGLRKLFSDFGCLQRGEPTPRCSCLLSAEAFLRAVTLRHNLRGAHVLQRLFQKSLPIYSLFRIFHKMQRRLRAGVPGSEYGAAVFIGFDGDIIGADLISKLDDLRFICADQRPEYRHISHCIRTGDGLDGLASSVTIMVAVFFTVVSVGMNSGIEPITCAVVGSLMGFLLFNVYPAKVFMGDTGSLALGGFVAGTAYVMQMPLFILLVGLIYLIEVLSVMIQVTYFKATHGKRIFKMAPIHHHFELCGWSETRVVAVFSVVTAVMCMIALLAL